MPKYTIAARDPVTGRTKRVEVAADSERQTTEKVVGNGWEFVEVLDTNTTPRDRSIELLEEIRDRLGAVNAAARVWLLFVVMGLACGLLAFIVIVATQ